jgi:hypothetical protein
MVEAKSPDFKLDRGRYKFQFDGTDFSFYYKDAKEKLAKPGVHEFLVAKAKELFIMQGQADDNSEGVSIKDDDESSQDAE